MVFDVAFVQGLNVFLSLLSLLFEFVVAHVSLVLDVANDLVVGFSHSHNLGLEITLVPVSFINAGNYFGFLRLLSHERR